MNIGKIYKLSDENLKKKYYYEDNYYLIQRNYNRTLGEQDLFILLDLQVEQSPHRIIQYFYLKILFDGKIKYINSIPCKSIYELPFQEVSGIVQT